MSIIGEITNIIGGTVVIIEPCAFVESRALLVEPCVFMEP